MEKITTLIKFMSVIAKLSTHKAKEIHAAFVAGKAGFVVRFPVVSIYKSTVAFLLYNWTGSKIISVDEMKIKTKTKERNHIDRNNKSCLVVDGTPVKKLYYTMPSDQSNSIGLYSYLGHCRDLSCEEKKIGLLQEYHQL